MVKKFAATGAVLVAAVGGALLATPAHADSWVDNWSRNVDSAQSGNTFAGVVASNHSGDRSVNVNNINGIAATATGGRINVIYIFH
ncbi:hypothetical protein J5X84_11120 [Streptosporangiaceae bacterium NEAU-GS5]|nr:hypothetical protein [Streptosporangiaceae bacterium NEAU-GS5]